VELAVVFGSLAAHTLLPDFVVPLLVVVFVAVPADLLDVLDLVDVLDEPDVFEVLVWLSESDSSVFLVVAVCVEFTLFSVDCTDDVVTAVGVDEVSIDFT